MRSIAPHGNANADAKHLMFSREACVVILMCKCCCEGKKVKKAKKTVKGKKTKKSRK